jgi:hypothetical protein
MTHVYRALWTDDSLSLIDVLPDELHSWLRSRGTPLEIRPNDIVVADHRMLTWSHYENTLGKATQFVLHEDHLGGWTTCITAMWTAEHNVLWADVLTDLPYEQVGIVNAPRVVRNLLLAGGEPQIGRDSIEVQPQEVDDQNSLSDLLDGLNDPLRVIPYLVIRGGKGTDMRLAVQRATRASETLAGLAQVFMVHEESMVLLNAALPVGRRLEELGARLFMPRANDEHQDERLSYFVPDSELDDDQKTLGRMMLRRIGATSQWPAVPVTWSLLKRECDLLSHALVQSYTSSSPAPPGVDATASPDTSIDQEEIERLRTEIERLQTELVVAAIAAEEAETKAESYLDHLVRELVTDRPDGPLEIRKGTIAATISQARQVANHLHIPASAEQSIEVLDRTEVSNVWARDLGQFFASLERYAYSVLNAGFQGDFLAWLKQNGDYSAQKIAMKESESVMKDPELRAKRVFGVSDALDVTGQKLMQAHAKIQIRGGGQIPRVYFFDDTKGQTGKVHIGFIGPHYLVPTASF